MKIKKLSKYLIGLPKTIYFNFKIFDIKTAVKLPVFVSTNVKIKNIYKHTVDINGPLKTAMIKIGLDDGTDINLNNKFSTWDVKRTSKVIFDGQASFSRGVNIIINENGKLYLGNNFYSNSCCNLFIDKEVKFGEDCLLGWNVSIHDGDGHKIYNKNGELINEPSSIYIGDHVWICADVKILKGSYISSNCIIARNSLVSKKLDIKNAVYGGSPVKLLKQDIKWEK